MRCIFHGKDEPAARDQSALAGQKRELIQAAGCIESSTFHSPPMPWIIHLSERPEIGIDVFLLRGLQRVDERIDLEPVGKGLSAATNKHRVNRSFRRVRGYSQAWTAPLVSSEKRANEEFPKFRVMADADLPRGRALFSCRRGWAFR